MKFTITYTLVDFLDIKNLLTSCDILILTNFIRSNSDFASVSAVNPFTHDMLLDSYTYF